MGGRALSVHTRRYNKAEYLKLQEELIHKLDVVYETVLDIPSYRDKEDYGDLDLIVTNTKTTNIKDYLINELNSKQIVSNGNTISFEYKEFQVDLIHITSNLELARTYFSYNDLGMLMGILAKRLNCKYGFNGLHYTYYNNDRSYKKDILLTTDVLTIFSFLDLDYNIFSKGFNKLTDIFDYVITSRYFDTKCFINEEEWNHSSRTRNRKRPNWNNFLNYLVTNSINISSPKIEGVKYYVNNYFSDIDLVQQLDDLDNEEQLKSVIKSKFNGIMVSELTDLVDKELGQFINSYKNSKLDFVSYIVSTEVNDIKQDIKSHFVHFTDKT
jgi:hypothetical protein